MSDRVDCLVFADQLEALVEGRLPEDARRHLLGHAAGCASCDAQLRVKEELSVPPLAELEAQVPPELVEGMYDRVRARLDRPPGGTQELRRGPPTAPSGRPPRLLVPLLAAATVALLLATGLLSLQLRDLRRREARLALELETQRARVTTLVGRGGGTRAGPPGTVSPLLHSLSRQETITVAELRELLDAVPPDRVILSEARLRVLRGLPLARTGGLMSGLLDGLPPGGGARAGELLQALDAVAVQPGLTFRTTDLVDLLS